MATLEFPYGLWDALASEMGGVSRRGFGGFGVGFWGGGLEWIEVGSL